MSEAFLCVAQAGTGDGMSLAALIVAIVGVVLGAGSLAWQIATHILTGARVTAELNMGVIADGKAVTWDVSADPPPPSSLQQLGRDPQLVFAVAVTNTGRLAINVHDPEIAMTGGTGLKAMGWTAVNPTTPYRLEPQSQQTWYLPADSVHAMAKAARDSDLTSGPIDAWGRVPLGNNSTVTTEQKARVVE